MHNVHFKYWLESEKQALTRAKDLADILAIAQNVLWRMKGPVHFVCGPISTGGVGTIRGNVAIFERVIEMLHDEEGFEVFSQLPFEDCMIAYGNRWFIENPKETYCMPILEEFYLPL